MKKLCKTCSHWRRSEDNYGDEHYFGNPKWGTCDLIFDNECSYDKASDKATANSVRTWDYEGYSSGAYVGENFGCIHWSKPRPDPKR